MPKLKTRKAARKRIKITKRGKVKASKAFRGHLLTHKGRKRKRHLKLKSVLSHRGGANLKATLPYR